MLLGNVMKRLSNYILLLILMLLTSCIEKSDPVLRMGTNVWPGYEPFYLARTRGFLSADKVHIVEFSSATQIIQVYRNNLIDAAALTLGEVLSLLGSGEKLKIVLVTDISNGGDAIVGQSDISTLTDIKGKRVGVENTALGAFLITRALELINLSQKSIKIIQLDINEQENAFLQHKVDAVVTFEPVMSKLLKSGGHLLFDSRQIPGEIVDVLVVRDEYLSANPDSVQYLINAWYQALAFMSEQPREAAKILGLRMKLDVDATLASYEGLILPDQKKNEQFLNQRPEPQLLLAAKKLMRIMHQQGFIKEKIDLATLFSDSGLQHK